MPTRILRALLAAALAAALLPGCDGGSSGPSNAISGVITGDTFVIPAGETRTAVGDLTIDTTGGIQIDGTLLVQQGVSVDLISDGPIVITGAITGVPTAALARATRPERKISGLYSDDIRLPVQPGEKTAVIDALPGIDLACACKTEKGVIVLNGKVSTADGRDGSGEGINGEDGGSLFIGTYEALAAAKAKGIASPRKPRTVVINGLFLLGAGGEGWSAATGFVNGISKTLEAVATSGGRGGGLTIEATSAVTITTGTVITGGRGGHGGGVGAAGKFLKAKNGTERGERGEALYVGAGAGGAGGSLIITAATVTDGSTGTPGNGGDAGSIFAAAGNGGPGGPGGNTLACLGLRGDPGQRVENTEKQADGSYGRAGSISLVMGGRGGASTHPEDPGGKGGNVDVRILDVIIRSLSKDTDYGTVEIMQYAGCGRGYDCPHPASGHVSGTAGGSFPFDGDALNGIAKAQPRVTIIESFDGGNGGNGRPPGSGGKAGDDLTGAQLGIDGVAGTPCPEAPPTSKAEEEPNNTPGTATPMGDARIATGAIATSNDLDHFRVTLPPGTYAFTLTSHTASPSFWLQTGPGITLKSMSATVMTITLSEGTGAYDVVWGLYGSVGAYAVTITKNP